MRESIAICVLLAYDCIAAVMKPCGKNIADTQYELIDPFSTHFLKNVTLSMKSSTHEPKGFNDG